MSPRTAVRLHQALVAGWAAVGVAALLGAAGVVSWASALLGVKFISLVSIYALVGAHWSAAQAAKADLSSLTPEEFRERMDRIERDTLH